MMIEEKVRVVRTELGYAWVESKATQACGQCSSGSACSSHVFSFATKSKARLVRVINPVYAKPGDQVIIGLRETTLLKHSLISYLLPLFSLLIFAIIGQQLTFLGNPEVLSTVTGLIGLAVGFISARFLTTAHQHEELPVILRTLESAVDKLAPQPLHFIAGHGQ